MPGTPNTFTPEVSQRVLELRQQTRERDEAAKAVETADKSVRQGEKDFAWGAVKGIFGALGSAPVELHNWLQENPQYDIQTGSNEWFKQKLVGQAAEAQRSGYELGNVVGWLTDPGIGIPRAGMVAGKVEELTTYLERQAADMKASKSHMNMDPDRFQKFKEFLKQHGLDWDKIIPMKYGEFNQGANPVKDAGNVKDEAGNILRSRDATQTPAPSSQHETNPLARSGAMPSGYGNPSQAMEEGGMYATRNIKDFKAHVEATLSSRANVASKGKGSAPPEFWVYDRSTKEIVVVKRAKDGTLYIGKRKGGPVEVSPEDTLIDPRTGVDKIDMVVESGAREKIDKMIYEAALERLDMK